MKHTKLSVGICKVCSCDIVGINFQNGDKEYWFHFEKLSHEAEPEFATFVVSEDEVQQPIFDGLRNLIVGTRKLEEEMREIDDR